MSKSDFYVSLPSNVSTKTYPNNRQSKYTTLLEEPLILPLNFQVALVEISNFSDFKVQMGKISFKNPFFGNIYEYRTENIEFALSIENGISLKDFCEKINYEILNNCIKTEYLYRQKLAFNLDERRAQAMKLINDSKFKEKKPFLNVLKLSFKRFVVIDTSNSVFKEIFIKCGGHYDYNSKNYVFKNLKSLEIAFNLIVLNVPQENENNSRAYYIDKKSIISNDILLVNQNDIKLLSKRDTSNKIDPYSQDIGMNESDDFTFSLTKEIWGSLPLIKQLDTNTIAIETKNFIKFEGFISKVLNNNDIEMTKISFTEVFNLPINLQLIKYILVYTDIIENQYYGNVRASILRTVNIKNNKDENVTFFDNPHYLNVSKTRIDTINIEICDINGNHIEFKDLFSNIFISLHFKHKNL
jgi:hypothetical protein